MGMFKKNTIENNSRTIAREISQQKKNKDIALGIVDNRPEAIQHKKLESMINSAPPAQMMRDRLRRDEDRAPTTEEIERATASATANSDRLSGHGRRAHGRRRNAPSGRVEQQTEESRQAAIDRTIQLAIDKGKSRT